MTRHAFERDESGAWGASRHETGVPYAGGHPMRWQGRASLPFRQQGHAACRTAVLARMLALILLARHAFVRSNRNPWTHWLSQRPQVMWLVVRATSNAGDAVYL